MELTQEITDLYSTRVWVRVRKSFITSTSWVRVQLEHRVPIWSTSLYSIKFYNLGARSKTTLLEVKLFIIIIIIIIMKQFLISWETAAIFFYPLVLVPVPIQLGKNGVKIIKIGIYYQCTCNVKFISKEEKSKNKARWINLSGNICCYEISGIVHVDCNDMYFRFN